MRESTDANKTLLPLQGEGRDGDGLHRHRIRNGEDVRPKNLRYARLPSVIHRSLTHPRPRPVRVSWAIEPIPTSVLPLKGRRTKVATSFDGRE